MSKTSSKPADPMAMFVRPPRALGLHLVRESDQWDLELFNAMREQTYLNHRDVAVVDAIRRVGLEPLRGESFTVTLTDEAGVLTSTEVHVEVLRRGATKAHLFYFGGYWHLWSQASAASVGQSGVNEFTSILIEVIERLRPVEVFAANFSRLIRSQAQGSRLSTAIEGNVDHLQAGTLRLTFVGPEAQVGLMMFNMFSMVASMERDWIVQRLMAGRISKWRRREWAFGKGTVPFGYKLDPASAELVVDESKRAQVREMMLILSRDAPPSQLARELDRAGITSMRKHRRLKAVVPVGGMSSTSALIDSLFAWAPLWCHGEYLFRVANVFPGMEELAGVPIVRDPLRPDDLGEMQMLYKVGVPEGGWAEPEVLQAFAEAAERNTRHLLENRNRNDVRPLAQDVVDGSSSPMSHNATLNAQHSRSLDVQSRARRAAARSRSTVAALAGRRWRDGNWEYELFVAGANLYTVVRWPARASEQSGSRLAMLEQTKDQGR